MESEYNRKIERIRKNKTWKREVAALIMGVFWYVVLETQDVEMVKVLVYPVFTFTAFAFGLDWFGKSGSVRWSPKLPDGRGSEHSGQRTGGQD